MQPNATGVSIFLVFVVIVAGVGPAAAVSDGSSVAQTEAPENCSFPVTATDATGTAVTIESEPQRIVTLAPSAAQTMWEIGAREKVVGMPVNPTTAYLNGSANRTGIYQADGATVATEQVVGLNPDLVLAPNIISNQTVQSLRQAGLTVYKFGFGQSFADIYAKTNTTGRLVGACDGADRIVAAMQTRIETIRQAVGNESEPRALYLLGGGFVAGNGTFIGDVIETAGAENLAANASIEGYKEISAEVVASRNPQWIITSNRSFIPAGAPYAGTTAVQQNQTIVVNTNLINQPAPRVVLPLTEIARKLHPEAMESANLTETPIGPANLSTENATTEQPAAADGGNATAAAMASPTATPSGTAGAAETTATPSGGGATANGGADQAGNATGTETTSSSGPGFGITVTAIALLGAALLTRRRV
jgi:iron complex transport system substrate-binding protein